MVIDSCLDCEASNLWKSFVIKGPGVRWSRRGSGILFFLGVTRTSCAAGGGGVSSISSSSSSNLVWWDLKRRSSKSFLSLGCACKSWIDMQAGMSVFANSPLCIIGQVFSCWFCHQIVGSTPNIWESEFSFASSDSFMNINWRFFPNARARKRQHQLSWFVGMCLRFFAVLTLDFSDLLA